jgi:nucleoid DNA-binding protein
MPKLTTDIKNNKHLAKYLWEFSGGAYHPYEFFDMLDILSEAVYSAVDNGYSVRITGLGRFMPEDVPERVIKSGLSGKIKLAIMKAHRKMKFITAVKTNRKLKADSIERNYK